jgi:hypothetical protein
MDSLSPIFAIGFIAFFLATPLLGWCSRENPLFWFFTAAAAVCAGIAMLFLYALFVSLDMARGVPASGHALK